MQGFNRWAPLVGGVLSTALGVLKTLGLVEVAPSSEEVASVVMAAGQVVGFVLLLYGAARKTIATIRG